MKFKKLLFLLFAMLAFSVGWANDVYVPVKSLDQLDLTNGQEVILVYGTTDFSGVVTNYDYSRTGLSYFKGKGAKTPLGESIEIGGINFPNVCTLTLQGTSDNFTIKDGDNYIYAGNRNVWLNYSPTLDETAEAYYWKAMLDENSGNFYIANVRYPSRPLKCQSSSYSATPNIYGSNNAAYPYAYLFIKSNIQSSLETNVSELDIDGSGTFTVYGENLSNDVAITLSSADRKKFAVSPKTIPSTGGSVNDVPVLVTYIGTDRTASGTVVVTSGNSIEVKVKYTAPEMFTTAGNYYVKNKGNDKYVVIDAENYNAVASAGNTDDADVVSLEFSESGIVSSMKQFNGTGDMMSVLDQVKSVLIERLEAEGYSTDFVDPMFRIRLINAGEENTVYFSLDIPAIDNIDEIRNYLLNEGGINTQLVKAYLDVLLQPGKRIYLCLNSDDNKSFSFTDDNTVASVKWVVEDAKLLETSVTELNIDGSGTFTVHGENLTDDVTVSLPSGSFFSERFLLSPKTISLIDNGVNDVPVTISYIGTETSRDVTITVKSGEKTTNVKVNYTAPDMFTTAGNYYVKNKGNDKYVVIDAENYDATASVDNKDDANVVTLDFDRGGRVTTMSDYYGDGDMIAILDRVKSELKERLLAEGYSTDFVDPMFRIRLINAGEENTMYFCLDVPAIENIDAVRNYLLNEAGLPAKVTGYLDVLLQPGKRIYLNATGDNGEFGFTVDDSAESSKWVVEKYVKPVDNLFTVAGDYYISNKGNSKYVVVTDEYDASASVDNEQDADVISLGFDTNGFVSTMKQKFGSGNIITMLDHVKEVLTGKLQDNSMDAGFLDEMFKIKLVKTGDEDGSVYFCFDIPRIENITAVRNYLLYGAGLPARVTGYLETLLQPGKRIYLNATGDNGVFGFTRDKDAAASKWMVKEYVILEDDLFTTPGDYYVVNKGNNNYVVIDAENYNATASASNQQDADIITLGFDGNGIVTTMKQKDGDGEGSDLIAILEHVKTVLKNRLNNANLSSDFLNDMFKIKLVKTGDADGSMYFCFDIPSIDNINAVRDFLLNEANLPTIVTGYLDVLLQPGKRIYLNATVDDGTFGFTKDNNANSSKWMVEQAEVVEDELFTEAGEYLVSNKGNNKYVVIDGENYNATASVEDQYDASLISIAFNEEDHTVSTMKNYDGEGDLLAILDQVKSELRNRIPDDINTDFLDEMFKIRLIKTGDEDGSVFFCFDIPRNINDLDRILEVVNNINNDRVKDYLNKLLQPGKRIYLCVDDLEQGTFNFTQDKRLDAAKWMVKSVKQTDRWTVIYFDMETANQYDYYFQAWDETDGEDNPYNYFENKPGVKVTSLPTTNIGKTKTVYEFSYRYKSKEPRLILTMGEGQHQTAEITPKNHEIFYYYGGGEYVYNDGEPRTEPNYTIGVPIDEVIFPDEGFRTYMCSTKFGKSVDGSFKSYDNNPSNKVLEPWEIENVDVLTATTDANVTIKDLTGIEYLTSLKEISLIGGRLSQTSYLSLDFETLDLTMLKNNSLEKINVSHADKMTTFELPEGYPLKSLSLSYCNAMPVGTLNERLATYAETLEELRLQNCSNFADLDITQNNKLKILEISSVPIPSLYLTGKNDLEVLRVGGTNITNDINDEIADKSKLRELSLSSNGKMQGTVLNIAGKPDFETLRVYNQDNYETITLDNAVSKLKYMVIDDNDNLTTLTLPTLTAMEDMWIERNHSLEGCTVDLAGNTSLKQININLNGSASTIKGMGSQMTDLRYVNTEHQLYDGNVLDLSNCANLHHLDVIDCNLDRISVDGCTALGTKITGDQNDMTLLVYGNHLRALDLEGVTLPYNFNISPRYEKNEGGSYSYVIDDINRYFMSGDYVYHAGYNDQSVPTIKPRVGYVFHEYYNTGEGTNSYTYMVYVSLASGGEVSEQDTDQSGEAVLSLNDLFRNWRAEGMADELPQSEYNGQTDEELVEQLAEKVADSGFDHNRVKLWKRFSENHPNTITTVARHGKGDELVYVHGTKGATTNSVRPRGAHEDPADWEIDPAEVKGDILVLGVYTVPVGVNEAVVSGKVSYLYGTRSDEADPEVENGDFVTESEETNFYKNKTLTDYNAAANTATGVNSAYDNTFPVEFKWEAKLTDKPEEIITNIEDLKLDLNREVAKVSYVNLMGVESDRPFEGVNIVVTRYTDGSVTTTKVIK